MINVRSRVLHPLCVATAAAFAVSGVLSAHAADFDKELEAQFVAAEVYQVAQADDDSVNDPLESVNRGIFFVNEFFYDLLLRPAAGLYTGFVPPPLRNVFGNLIDNLRTPIILVNDLLQGELDRAWVTTQRFAINTTYGIGGMFDRATGLGFERHDEDFGQTLAVWGVPEPVYLVLPLLGPSNPRDAVGKVADGYLDPLNHYLDNIDEDEAFWARMSTEAVDEYSGISDELDQIKKTSVDYYAAIRSMYRQKRAAEIRNGAEADLPPIPDLGLDNDLKDGDSQPAATQPSAPAKGKDQISQWRPGPPIALVPSRDRIEGGRLVFAVN